MGDSAPTWKFNQCFGERTVIDDVTEQDILSSVEFNQTGDYLATGDKAGRIVVFEIDNPSGRNSNSGTKDTSCPNGHSNGPSPVFAQSASVLRSSNNANRSDVNKISSKTTSCEYKFQCEFQSHEPEFDYLKSLEIEEKINKIRWCRPSNDSLFLLSTNDKTIKLWKTFEKKVLNLTSFNLPEHARAYRRTSGSWSSWTGTCDAETVKQFDSVHNLKLPDVSLSERLVSSTPRKVYSNAHAYHVNSIAVNSDGETFLSADDLRINLWNLHLSDQSFTIVDIKPENMEELQEVITGADFHPSHCNIFMYSSSRGSIKLADMRERALCDQHAKLFEEPEQPGNKSFFSEIIASLSDIKFTSDGRYIISRDFLTLKVWDINMESRPIQTINIHEHLRSKLCDLYENECIFDKFEVAVSGDGNNMVTGSYNNTFHIYNRNGRSEIIEASSNRSILQDTGHSEIDFNMKALHLGFHPTQQCVAVACVNNLYVYTKF